MTTILNRHLLFVSMFILGGFAYLDGKINAVGDAATKSEVLLRAYGVESNRAFDKRYMAEDIEWKNIYHPALLLQPHPHITKPQPITKEDRLIFEKHLNVQDDLFVIKLLLPCTDNRKCLIIL